MVKQKKWCFGRYCIFSFSHAIILVSVLIVQLSFHNIHVIHTSYAFLEYFCCSYKHCISLLVLVLIIDVYQPDILTFTFTPQVNTVYIHFTYISQLMLTIHMNTIVFFKYFNFRSIFWHVFFFYFISITSIHLWVNCFLIVMLSGWTIILFRKARLTFYNILFFYIA